MTSRSFGSRHWSAGKRIRGALIEIAPALGENWLLVGGQMVFLHELERRAEEVRPTDDVDVVVDLRVEADGLERVHEVLTRARFAQDPPSPKGVAHRYRRSGAVIDVLAPDHIGRRAKLSLGADRTIEAPGTSQAFVRSSIVRIELADGAAGLVRRPTLIGALIGKAAAVTEIVSQTTAERAKHVRDFDALARLLGADDRESARLTKKERADLDRLRGTHELSALASASLDLLVKG